MFGSTMMLTVGQALDRAQQERAPIRIHLGGEWLSGRVEDNDSQSVLLRGEDGTSYLIRIEAISCVGFPQVDEQDRSPVPTQPTEARSRAGEDPAPAHTEAAPSTIDEKSPPVD